MAAADPTAVVHRFYAAFAARDLEAVGACFHPDAVWTLPGTSPIAGRHTGWPAIRDDFLARAAQLGRGSFDARLLDVAAGERYVVAIQHAVGDHDGKRLDITACQLIRVEDGLIVEVRGHYSDQQALDAFWSA
jgi:ketosteroid isomerase-like protein